VETSKEFPPQAIRCGLETLSNGRKFADGEGAYLLSIDDSVPDLAGVRGWGRLTARLLRTG
jgi:hypothetical protein